MYKQAGKCADQQQFKDIIEAAMVSTPEGLTNDSTTSPTTSTPFKKPHARKSLCLFTNILDVKKKTDTRQFRAAKSELKVNKYGTTPWALKQKRKGHSKISEQIKKSLYKCITYHPQVVQPSIANDFLKVNIDGYNEPKLVPKWLLQVSVRELHNYLVSSTKYGGLK